MIRKSGNRFPKRSCSNKKIERDDESKRSHHALAGGEQGKRHGNRRALSWRGDERDSTAELLRHEILDDVQAEPGTALRTSGGEERIENVTLNLFRNAPAVIRESDLDLFHAEATRL